MKTEYSKRGAVGPLPIAMVEAVGQRSIGHKGTRSRPVPDKCGSASMLGPAAREPSARIRIQLPLSIG